MSLIKNQKLSYNFTLGEMCKSDTADRNFITNIPGEAEIENMINLCQWVLQPIRNYYDRPVKINSGYRCLELNGLLHSSDNSQHVKGEAADVEIYGISNVALARWIERELPYDQLILEMYNPEDGPNSGWVHVSHSYRNNRKESLTIFSKKAGGGTHRGILEEKPNE